MVEREIDISKKRWSRFKEMIRREIPECIIDTIDNGRKERYWKIKLSRKINSTEVHVILKPRRKLMTYHGGEQSLGVIRGTPYGFFAVCFDL